MIIHWDIEQNTKEWMDVRRRKLTASVISQVITPGKLEVSKSAKPLALKLIAAGHGEEKPSFSTWETRRGHELESWAASWYQISKGVDLSCVGFVERDDQMFGCSPDRVMIQCGQIASGLQIKCQTLPVHIEQIESGKLSGPYLLQCHAEMIACEVDSWVYLAYHPSCKEQFVQVIERDSTTIKIEQAINSFIDMMKELEDKYIIKEP